MFFEVNELTSTSNSQIKPKQVDCTFEIIVHHLHIQHFELCNRCFQTLFLQKFSSYDILLLLCFWIHVEDPMFI